LTGPKVVREALVEDVSMDELGGPGVHGRNGVCQFVAADVPSASRLTRELLSFLPARIGERPPLAPAMPPGGGAPDAVVPDEARRLYEVREVCRALAGGGRLLDLDERWARNMVTGFARIDGRSVGVVANQPAWLGGVIDAEASEKAA